MFIVIMQRAHERDLSGHILTNEMGWTHLCLPAVYEPKHPHPDPPLIGNPQVDRKRSGMIHAKKARRYGPRGFPWKHYNALPKIQKGCRRTWPLVNYNSVRPAREERIVSTGVVRQSGQSSRLKACN